MFSTLRRFSFDLSFARPAANSHWFGGKSLMRGGMVAALSIGGLLAIGLFETAPEGDAKIEQTNSHQAQAPNIVGVSADEERILHQRKTAGVISPFLDTKNLNADLQKFKPQKPETMLPASTDLLPAKYFSSDLELASLAPGYRSIGDWRDQLPNIFSRFDGPVARFREKLAALQNGERSEPVVVLHIGDSHIASDSYTRGIRRRLQQRFGDAGRGAVIPSNAFKYAAADAVKLSSSGSWKAHLSLKSSRGIFGISGVRTESASSSARMTLVARDVFDSARVTVATGPNQGSFEVSVDGISKRYSAKSPNKGAKTFEVDLGGKKLTVRPVGNGRVGVLHWATSRDKPGIRYVNFGQVGATVNVTRRWNSSAVRDNLIALKPDLIVYGFGTNEGFNDNVNPDAYKKYVGQFLQQLRQHAPQADMMLIGAPDGLRRKRGKSCGNGWYVPVRLGDIRQAMKTLADEMSAGYWDWSAQMGGACGINDWARAGYAAKDRVHLTSKGYDRSAKAFYHALVGPLDTPLQLAKMR